MANDFCAQASIELEEPIIGTAAAQTSVWLGVEVRGVWPRNAFDCSTVPDALRDRLPMWAAALPGFRPQALRRPGHEECPDPAVFVALTGPDCDTVVRLDVPSLEALGELDLSSVVETIRAGGVPTGARRVEETTLWVCVHGKRDRCCAKFGVPVYEAASRLEDVDVWQTSHLGGHRFAATLLCLPSGLCYGRVQAADVAPLVRNHGQGRVHDLSLFRGRSCWSAPGQAAVHFVRAHVGEMTLAGFVPGSEVEVGGGVRVRVESPRGTFEVLVEKRAVGGEASPSCEKPPAPVAGWFQADLQSV